MIAALFDGYGMPMHRISALAPATYESILDTHPVCRILCNLDDPASWDRTDADLIYVLPPGPGPHQIAPEHLGALVAALDQNGRIVLHGTHHDAVVEAIDTMLVLTGGGHG